MGAMKPRSGPGPLEVTKEGRSYILRIPVGQSERLVVSLDVQEAEALAHLLTTDVRPPREPDYHHFDG